MQKLQSLDPESAEYKEQYEKLAEKVRQSYTPGLITKYTKDLIDIAAKLKINLNDYDYI